jgi:hypothetical protein
MQDAIGAAITRIRDEQAAEAVAQAGVSAIGTHVWNCECGYQDWEDCTERGDA